MGLHIFWDNSNVWGGAQDTRKIKEQEVPWFALRVYLQNLYQFVTQGRDAITKVMAGSVPPECEDLWEYARTLGFDTDLLRRVQDNDGRYCEQAVDEMLHLKISNAVLDHTAPQTLIIISGDGKDSDYGTSFPKQVVRAIKNGWDAEIYSWSECFNNKKYDPLITQYGDKLKVVYLDGYYHSLTFVKGGEYYKRDDEGNKVYYEIPSRVVSSL